MMFLYVKVKWLYYIKSTKFANEVVDLRSKIKPLSKPAFIWGNKFKNENRKHWPTLKQ